MYIYIYIYICAYTDRVDVPLCHCELKNRPCEAKMANIAVLTFCYILYIG